MIAVPRLCRAGVNRAVPSTLYDQIRVVFRSGLSQANFLIETSDPIMLLKNQRLISRVFAAIFRLLKLKKPRLARRLDG